MKHLCATILRFGVRFRTGKVRRALLWPWSAVFRPWPAVFSRGPPCSGLARRVPAVVHRVPAVVRRIPAVVRPASAVVHCAPAVARCLPAGKGRTTAGTWRTTDGTRPTKAGTRWTTARRRRTKGRTRRTISAGNALFQYPQKKRRKNQACLPRSVIYCSSNHRAPEGLRFPCAEPEGLRFGFLEPHRPGRSRKCFGKYGWCKRLFSSAASSNSSKASGGLSWGVLIKMLRAGSWNFALNII